MPRPSEQQGLRARSQADRARWAWNEVRAVARSDDEYLTEARKLPARLLTSGLGQTMAYLYAKAKGKEATDSSEDRSTGVARLYSQLARRIRGDSHPKHTAMDVIVELGAREYRVLGREIQETAEWIKRFAEGRIGSKSSDTTKARGETT